MPCYYSSFSKETRLRDLACATQFCNLCERMSHRAKILSEANGNPDSKVIFIGEAPGRLGADRTGVPFHGDRTGDNFEKLLGNIGWDRDSVFITNAILCNPRGNNGTNSTPTMKEIKKCSVYLEMTLNLVNPEVIVTLGRVALEILSFIKEHDYSLSTSIGKPCQWDRYTLFPLYHPGPRAMVHRPFAKQTADYIVLSKIVDPINGLKKGDNVTKRDTKKVNAIDTVANGINSITKVVNTIIQSVEEISYFKLLKLLYFIDYLSVDRYGQSITGEIYLRQQEGPWLPKLRKYLTELDGYEIELFFQGSRPFLKKGAYPRLMSSFTKNESTIISEVLENFANKTESEIKTAVYLTKPMRYILKQEKMGKKMLNRPVLYANKTIIELDAVINENL